MVITLEGLGKNIFYVYIQADLKLICNIMKTK